MTLLVPGRTNSNNESMQLMVFLRSYRLTDRERHILALLREGLSNKKIAQRLGIVEYTVKKHLVRIFAKICAKNRTHAALWAARNDIGSEYLSEAAE